MVAFAERPVESSQVSGLGGALAFIADHIGEPLTLARVARVAGFAPSYFSALFKRHEGETFERYVRRMRIERAKELLAQNKAPDRSRCGADRLSATPLFLPRVQRDRRRHAQGLPK